MNRNITEFLKIPEAVRVPVLGGALYRYFTKLDNRSIIKEKLPQNPLNTEKRAEKVIVSLTSFPARIAYVHLAIKSLMLQSYKPDRIILWLAEEQFPTRELPKELTNLCSYGLEIYFVKDNLYGHKKYFYIFQGQKEGELVITYDDDLIYPTNSIERLIKTHAKYPTVIVCNRAQALAYDKNGDIKNPGRWDTISQVGLRKPSYKLCPSTGGGCLYPYNVLCEDAKRTHLIEELALKGDDLWIMFMASEKGTPILKTRKYHRWFTVIQSSQSVQLSTGNLINNEYFKTLEKLIQRYPLAWERIKGEKE